MVAVPAMTRVAATTMLLRRGLRSRRLRRRVLRLGSAPVAGPGRERRAPAHAPAAGPGRERLAPAHAPAAGPGRERPALVREPAVVPERERPGPGHGPA